MPKLYIKNIAFFCPAIYPCVTGGMEINTYHLIKAISKQATVSVFSVCDKLELPNITKYKIYSRMFFIRRYNLAGISYLLSLLYLLIKSNRKIDVFHVNLTDNTKEMGLIFPVIKLLFNIDYVLVLHGGMPLKSWGVISLTSFLFKHAKKIITVSEDMKQKYMQHLNRQIDVIPSLVPFVKNTESKPFYKNKLGFKNTDQLLIMIGSIKPLKGNDIVLDAFKKLGIEFIKKHNLHLIFAGQGPLAEELRAIVKNSDIEHHIHFLGNISNDVIHEIYSAASIYITASWFESLSITLLEAMSNSLPILASDIEVFRSNIKSNENGLLFEKNNSSELAIGIKKLIENPDYANLLGQNARKVFDERFSFEKVCNKMLNIYNT
jgi:glycosyltransferase involved in cell wall biosynthesis